MINEGNSFDDKAATWDDNPMRINLVNEVWDVLSRNINFQEISSLLDYGCGTGLLGYKTAHLVDKVTFCDTSEGMLEQVRQKSKYFNVQNIDILKSDFTVDTLPEQHFNLIATMLVLHHVEQLDLILSNFNQLLTPNGIFCWIDIDEEDGSFHSDNTGIHHFGFSKNRVQETLVKNGFELIFYDKSVSIPKEAENGIRLFPLFIAVAKKKQ